MFILEFLPSWVFYILAIGGAGLFALSFFASNIPLISQYGMAAQIIAVLLMVLGIYFIGASANQETWEKKVADLENKMLVLQNVQPVINSIVVEKFIEKPVEVIRNRTETVVKHIPEIITKEVDGRCEIPADVIQLHNSAIMK